MPVKFFCEKCGREMWDLVNWEKPSQRHYTIGELLDMCLCSDCTLAEAKEDHDENTECSTGAGES